MDQTTIPTPYCLTPGNVTTVDPADGCQGGDVQELSRLQLLNEWIRNESEFVACLDSIDQMIASPILDRVYMDPSCIDALPGVPIFLSTAKILKSAHSCMLQQLEQVSRSWCERSSTVGDVIAHHIGIIRILLHGYSCGIGIVAAAIRRSTNRNETPFLPVLSEVDLREESLRTLSNPLTRLPYYEYILRRFLDRTNLDHADNGLLSRAIKFVRSASKHIANANEICRQHQSARALEETLDLNLVESNRILLLQGELTCSFSDHDCLSAFEPKKSLSKLFPGKQRPFLSGELREHPVFVVLFNDVMILSRKLPDGSQSAFDVIPLRSCSINVSENLRQKILNVKCCDGRVYHFHSMQLGESFRWMESVLKAYTEAITKTNDGDEFRTQIVYRNEYCQLRIAQQSVIITGFENERHERAHLDVHHIRLFSDPSDDCIIQFSSATKHIIVFAQSAKDAQRITQYVKMEQFRIRSLLPALSTCCERSKSHSIQVNYESCSLCNSYIACSSCLTAATLLSIGGKPRSVVCQICRKVYFQNIIGCPIPDIKDNSEEDRNWVNVEPLKSEVGFREARRIRHNRRFGITRLADLDVRSAIRIPRLEPDGCISTPLLRLRDELCKPPSELPIPTVDVPRVQCASCLEFKSVNNENRFCGVCGHDENLVNDRLAFLFYFHDTEKALVKQQIALFNTFLSEVSADIYEPAQMSQFIYRPPNMASTIRFDTKPNSAANNLSFMLEGKFNAKLSCRQIPCRNWMNSGAASFCVSLRIILDFYMLMLGELEDHLHKWNSNSCLAEMLMRYFPQILAIFRVFICNYYEALERFSSRSWKFLFFYLQLHYNLSVSVLDMILMTFDRIRSFYLILYKENMTEGGCYHDQLQQLSGGLALLINRVHDRNISIRMARLLLLPVASYSSERFLYNFVIQTIIPGERAAHSLLVLTNDVCILAHHKNGEDQKLSVYTCRRSTCDFTETFAEMENFGLKVLAIKSIFYEGPSKQQNVFFFGKKPSETHAMLRTLLSWKNAPPKNLPSVTIHSPRFKSGKSSLHCYAIPLHFSPKEFSEKNSMRRQCPGCGRICASAFCSSCGTRTNQIIASTKGNYAVF